LPVAHFGNQWRRDSCGVAEAIDVPLQGSSTWQVPSNTVARQVHMIKAVRRYVSPTPGDQFGGAGRRLLQAIDFAAGAAKSAARDPVELVIEQTSPARCRRVTPTTPCTSHSTGNLIYRAAHRDRPRSSPPGPVFLIPAPKQTSWGGVTPRLGRLPHRCRRRDSG